MGHCASAPLEAKERRLSQPQHLEEEYAPPPVGSPVRVSRASTDSSPAAGAGHLVFAEIDQGQLPRSGSGRSSESSGQPQDTHFMVRVHQWHSFDLAGFLVESHRGPGGACIYDAVLSGPAAVLAWLQAQAGRAAAQDNSHHCQLHSHTLTLRIRWDALQSLPGIKALALAAPSAPLTTTEAARLKAFAASVAQGKQPRDLSQRARLMSGRGRKAFLPRLVGDMLVATGQLQQAGPELVYNSAKHHSWSVPDLHFSWGQHSTLTQRVSTSSTSGVHHHTSSIKSKSTHWGSSPLPANMHNHHHYQHPQQPMPHVTIITDGGDGVSALNNVMSYPISADNLSPRTSLSSIHTTGRINALSPNISGDFAAAAKPATPAAPSTKHAASAGNTPSAATAGVAGPAAEATTSWSMLSRLVALPSFLALSTSVQQPLSAATAAAAASSGSSLSMRRHQQQVVQVV